MPDETNHDYRSKQNLAKLLSEIHVAWLCYQDLKCNSIPDAMMQAGMRTATGRTTQVILYRVSGYWVCGTSLTSTLQISKSPLYPAMLRSTLCRVCLIPKYQYYLDKNGYNICLVDIINNRSIG